MLQLGRASGERWSLLLRNAAFPGTVFQLLQAIAGVMTFVGHQLGRVLRLRVGVDRCEVGSRSIVASKAERMVDISIALFARFAGNSRISELLSIPT